MKSRLHPLILLGSLIATVLLVPAGYVASRFLGIPDEFRWRGAVLIAFTLVMLFNLSFPAVYRFVNSSAKMTTFFMHYDAESRVTLSHVEAMIAAGRYEDATAEIDLLLRMHGLDKGLCLLAVDLHLGKFGSPARAEALLRRMRQEQPQQWELFVTQRLIDLYMTNVESHSRAMTELRRMIARFPGTPEASGAEACLKRLRQDHHAPAV